MILSAKHDTTITILIKYSRRHFSVPLQKFFSSQNFHEKQYHPAKHSHFSEKLRQSFFATFIRYIKQDDNHPTRKLTIIRHITHFAIE